MSTLVKREIFFRTFTDFIVVGCLEYCVYFFFPFCSRDCNFSTLLIVFCELISRPAHLDVSLACFRFGNLIAPGTFISHFIRPAYDNSGGNGNDDRCLKVARQIFNENLKTPMFVDFEHDREIFIIVFAVYGGEHFCTLF